MTAWRVLPLPCSCRQRPQHLACAGAEMALTREPLLRACCVGVRGEGGGGRGPDNMRRAEPRVAEVEGERCGRQRGHGVLGEL